MHFSYLLLTKNLSFSLPSPFFPHCFQVSWIPMQVPSSVSSQRNTWPIRTATQPKRWKSAGKKEMIRKFWVHVFYDFPFSTSSASSISLPSLTISSTRIFPSVATKYSK